MVLSLRKIAAFVLLSSIGSKDSDLNTLFNARPNAQVIGVINREITPYSIGARCQLPRPK